MKQYTLVLWLLLAVLLPGLLPAQTITIRDTTVQRGSIFPVHVYADDIPQGQSIRIKFTYENSLAYYTRAEGGDSRIMLCTPPDAQTLNGESGQKDTLIVNCASIRPATPTGILLTLYFEALAGSDSVVDIESYELTVDGVDVMGVAHRKGRITIPGLPVFPQPNESLSQNYPNPFSLYTSFDYNVNADTDVEFRVLTLVGREVDPTDYKSVQTKTTFSIEPGFNMANGAYLMQMKTDNGVYQVPFFFIR